MKYGRVLSLLIGFVLISVNTAAAQNPEAQNPAGQGTAGGAPPVAGSPDDAAADGPLVRAEAAEEIPQAKLELHVRKLVEQLGAPKYAEREGAQAELKRLGLTAFDALRKAQNHDDIEIATRARYLLNSMHVRWHLESDPKVVRDLLSRYGQRADQDRQAIIDHISQFEYETSMVPLCRLVRFEISMRLSKRAALNVMQLELPEDPKVLAEFADEIRKTVGDSPRVTANWLRLYAETIVSPAESAPRWAGMIQREHQAYAQFPDDSDVAIIRDFQRWHADLFWKVKQPEEATKIVRGLLRQLQGSRAELLDVVEWLIERKAWDLVDELAGRFHDEFGKHAQLQYLLAEAQTKRGLQGIARQTSDGAYEMGGMNSAQRSEVAQYLQDRGMFAWAQRELEHIIDQGPEISTDAVDARLELSEMHHDQQRDVEAAQQLKAVAEFITKDPDAARNVLAQVRRTEQSVLSRMHTFYAAHYATENDWKKAKEHIQKGIGYNPQDADLLIAMFRAQETDDQWKVQISKLVRLTSNSFRQRVQQVELMVGESATAETQDKYQSVLAQLNNQYSWLVANTEGDYKHALKCSQRSLELQPGAAGFIDTLGRCYYAVGDLENAVREQRRAVKLEPHSGQIRRQLKFFEKALAESRGKEKQNQP
ncbi:MAG: tetratricopeptide (TPR) repeat protein [Pirellulaceae bacterium]|jgi:tetratricopeptide (TPR) repeat protein